MRILLYVPVCLLLLVQGANAQECATGFRILGWPHAEAPSGSLELSDFQGGEVVLMQNEIARAEPGFGYNDQPTVFIRLTRDGRNKLYRYTRDHVRLPIALVYGDTLLTAPRIMEPIGGGQAQITGLQTSEEAHDMAVNINSGICPPEAGS